MVYLYSCLCLFDVFTCPRNEFDTIPENKRLQPLRNTVKYMFK